MKIDATHIKKLLERRHTKDFYMCEVKNGSTWYSNDMMKFDVFAMKLSWANPLITIYEIKVSRQDFLRDQKYMGYLQYCNQFYFVCPTDLIKLDELPDNVGLIYCREQTIRVVRKAKYREVDIPKDLFIYLIMTRLESDRYPFHNSKKEFFEEWIATKQANKNLGFEISQKFLEIIQENKNLKNDADTLNHIKEILKTNNMDAYMLTSTIENLVKSNPISKRDLSWFETDIDRAIADLQSAKLRLSIIKNKGQNHE